MRSDYDITNGEERYIFVLQVPRDFLRYLGGKVVKIFRWENWLYCSDKSSSWY